MYVRECVLMHVRARVCVFLCVYECVCTCVSVRVCVYISVSERDLDSLISIDDDGTAAGRNQFGGEGGDVGGSVGDVQPLQVARRTVVVVAVHIDNVLCRERERERVRVREKERKDRTR